MKLGLVAGYSPAQVELPVEQIIAAEQLGFDSVWTSEAYGSDALTPAAWILAKTSRIKVGTAIVQMPARTPTCTAMSAMTLSAMSGGRFILGIGPSGPGVIEGWHGVAYGRPLTRTREYVSILRKIFARRERLEHSGHHYQIPYGGPDAKGVGKPMKSILHAEYPIPIYTAAITPAGLRCAGEVADGVFPIWMNPERFDLLGPFIEEGLAKSVDGRTMADFDVAPFLSVAMGDDLDQCRAGVKAHLALYIGGMGPPGHNFYNDYAVRMGYEVEARQIQELYLTGNKAEAMQAVPDQLVDDCALVGPAARIRERLVAWKEAGRSGKISSLLVGGASVEALQVLAEELL